MAHINYLDPHLSQGGLEICHTNYHLYLIQMLTNQIPTALDYSSNGPMNIICLWYQVLLEVASSRQKSSSSHPSSSSRDFRFRSKEDDLTNLNATLRSCKQKQTEYLATEFICIFFLILIFFQFSRITKK